MGGGEITYGVVIKRKTRLLAGPFGLVSSVCVVASLFSTDYEAIDQEQDDGTYDSEEEVAETPTIHGAEIKQEAAEGLADDCSDDADE